VAQIDATYGPARLGGVPARTPRQLRPEEVANGWGPMPAGASLVLPSGRL